jgi:hypothetical protein
MSGITNRPQRLEDENQRRVEDRKDELPQIDGVNRPRKDHPLEKDRDHEVDERGRVSETGAGRGTEQKGH